MTTATRTFDATPRSRRDMFRAGGLAAIALGLSYIVITVVYVLGGALPHGVEEWLRHLGRHTTGWWVILGLSVLTDVLFLPVALSLYLALKDINGHAVLAGAGLVALFAILDLAVTWPNYSSLITLSGSYGAAADEVQRGIIVAAASYPSAVLTSTLFAVYAILVPSVGILIIGLVMRKGPFSRVTAYCGVATGILGIVAVAGPFVARGVETAAIVASVLTTVWVLLVGVRLYHME